MRLYEKQNFRKNLLTCILGVSFAVAIIFGAVDYSVPEQSISLSSVDASAEDFNVNSIVSADAKVKVFGIPVKDVEVDVVPQKYLIPCGDVFGVKFFTKGVIVVGMSDVESTRGILNPAYKSGIRVGDIIISLNGKEVNTVEEVASIIEKSDGNAISVEFKRDDVVAVTNIVPLKALSDGKYKSGLWVRDSTAGIGTITYFDPQTGKFGGLGHGICDIDTGSLMPMLKGNVVDINVTDIIRGSEGIPGEIKGEFGVNKTGELFINSDRGVFGALSKTPLCAVNEPIEIALGNEVKEGSAYLYSSVGDNEVKRYDIELTKIYHNDSKTKNFIFSVKDKDLIKKTGGIIQGMSGSPIVQDGKLIGAVTHVLVNNPAKGYGIFIENMLAEAEKIK